MMRMLLENPNHHSDSETSAEEDTESGKQLQSLFPKKRRDRTRRFELAVPRNGLTPHDSESSAEEFLDVVFPGIFYGKLEAAPTPKELAWDTLLQEYQDTIPEQKNADNRCPCPPSLPVNKPSEGPAVVHGYYEPPESPNEEMAEICFDAPESPNH